MGSYLKFYIIMPAQSSISICSSYCSDLMCMLLQNMILLWNMIKFANNSVIILLGFWVQKDAYIIDGGLLHDMFECGAQCDIM